MRVKISLFLIFLLGILFFFNLGVKTLSYAFTAKKSASILTTGRVLSEEVTPTPTCTEPSGGCGTGYYWDSSSCSCHTNTVCPSPSGGCGTNYYWNSSSCSCQANTSCTPPSGGCGTSYYWDSTSCTCKYYSVTSYCSPPSAGCGTNYYWDSATCMCKAQEGTCTAPSSGCPVNYYWNTSSCSCQIPTSTCNSPSAGCAANYYWDTSSCSCKAYSTCQQPSAGCGSGYYWDSSSCSCKPSSTCYPPTNGCGGNYYWDSASCLCRQISSTCYPPSGGCGANYTWDSYYCYCKLTSSCYPPTSGCTGGSYWDYYTCSCKSYTTQPVFDRFAYEPQDRINCVRSILTAGEFEKLRYGLGITTEEQNEIQKLGEKVKSCWVSAYTAGSGQVTAPSTETLRTTVDNESCLIGQLGEKAYREVYTGLRKPTYEEHLKFESCFGNVRPDSVKYISAGTNIPQEIDNCLKNVLEAELYQKVKEGEADVPYEYRAKVEGCFGVNPHPFIEGKVYTIPDEIKTCLLKTVGDTRFNEIRTGGIPTEEEKGKAESCFAKLNKSQKNFLPPPSEEVFFLEEKSNVINFSQFKQETAKVNNKSVGGKVTFTGVAPAASTVTIYIYSEPIVITTKTDENGDWVYELNQPLKGEKHIAYATVRDVSGKVVRSSVFNFEVVAAEPIEKPVFLQETESGKSMGKFLYWALLIVGLGAFVAGSGIAYYFIRFRKETGDLDKSQNSASGDGKSEGKF